ncbi:MAG TPA: HPr family phosphocarrier protein [Anaerolineales bacterium]|jgi:phosphotransferase system HPr (HPr) family protein|nr:HPr family phosphocarrier protein [Anaerolineales bacterium]|tara:strand:+ start:471 stop:749 length:279 start_codon:yes stop_codon:yes gene_type:complete
MESIQVTVSNSVGLHARPAALFVQAASRFPCELTATNLTTGSEPVNAKSILAVLTLGAEQGHLIEIAANGEETAQALTAMRAVIESSSGEVA